MNKADSQGAGNVADHADSQEAGIVADVSRNLGAFFRHLLPGILIIGAAYGAHPAWFTGIDSMSWQHIVLGATIAVVSGNIWFALNRYGVAQFIDFLFYMSKCNAKPPLVVQRSPT